MYQAKTGLYSCLSHLAWMKLISSAGCAFMQRPYYRNPGWLSQVIENLFEGDLPIWSPRLCFFICSHSYLNESRWQLKPETRDKYSAEDVPLSYAELEQISKVVILTGVLSQAADCPRTSSLHGESSAHC